MNKSVSGIKNGNRRSVRNIDRPNSKHRQRKPSGSDQQPPRQSRNQNAATYGMWFIGLILLLLLFFLFSVAFAKTTVTVTPRTAPIAIDNTFTASLDTAGTSSASNLTYTLTSVSDTVTSMATSSGSEYREASATGEITIYNEYSTDSIRLVPETRFQSPDGLIYKTRTSVTVPGMEGDSPGQVTVPVTAAEVGGNYNLSGDVRFSIPGFAGTPQDGVVYAKLANPISGGIADEVPVIATSTKKSIARKAQSDLRDDLQQQLNEELGDSVVTYDDAVFFETETNTRSRDNGAEIAVIGTLQAATFDRRELAIFLANQSGIDATADTNLYIQNLPEFDLSVVNRADYTPDSSQTLNFTMSGNSTVVWEFNQQALARDLQSLQKSQITDVLENYPAIQSAEINTRPFWKRSLPSDVDEITIETSLTN